jgi:hypothetical protein
MFPAKISRLDEFIEELKFVGAGCEGIVGKSILSDGGRGARLASGVGA